MADRLADLRMKRFKKTKKRPRLLPSVRELAMPLDATVAVRALTRTYALHFAERDDELLRTTMNKAYDAVLARLPETPFELEQAQAALRAARYGAITSPITMSTRSAPILRTVTRWAAS